MNVSHRTRNFGTATRQPEAGRRGGLQALARRAWLRLFGFDAGDEDRGNLLPPDGVQQRGHALASFRDQAVGGAEALRPMAPGEAAELALQRIGRDLGQLRGEHGAAGDQENRTAGGNLAAQGLRIERLQSSGSDCAQPETQRADPAPLVANDFRRTESYKAEGIIAYQRTPDARNPYRAGTHEAKAWDTGYLDEHKRAPHELVLPEWIARAQWNLADATARYYGIQNVMAMSDAPMESFSGGSAMAALRGIPEEPPKWLMKEAWARASNSRYADLRRLEKRCFLDMKTGIRAMYDREEARKNCKHQFEDVFINGAPMGERVCPTCGTLESMTLV